MLSSTTPGTPRRKKTDGISIPLTALIRPPISPPEPPLEEQAPEHHQGQGQGQDPPERGDLPEQVRVREQVPRTCRECISHSARCVLRKYNRHQNRNRLRGR
ncbi:hypothetical protein ACHAWF_018497 [Thalassiosira exigua]